MDKSWKSTLNIRPSIPRPEIQWEPDRYTLEEVLAKFPLPRVVKCDVGQLSRIPIGTNSFDFSQPMLLYDHRDVDKFAADNVSYQTTLKKHVTVGKTLLIPKDYKGWFALVSEAGSTSQRPIPLHTNVESLVKNGVSTFLIGGNQRIRCLQMDKHFSGQPDSRTLLPGDVLRVCGVYVAKTRFKKKRILRDKVYTTEEKLILCTDEKDRQLYIKLDTKGYFYTLSSTKNSESFAPIVQLNAVSETQLPVLVKLVYGNIPTTPCSFTGTMILTSVFKEESVISSTILNVCNIMLEVPVNTNLVYFVAKDEKKLMASESCKNALSLCYEKANTYKHQIKVSFITLENENDGASIYSGPENPPPPIPRRQRSVQSDSASSKHDSLNTVVPISSAPSIRLCFGSNSVELPVNKDGTLKHRSSSFKSDKVADAFTLNYIETLGSEYVNFSYALLEKSMSEESEIQQDRRRETLSGTFTRPRVQSTVSMESSVIYENVTLMQPLNEENSLEFDNFQSTNVSEYGNAKKEDFPEKFTGPGIRANKNSVVYCNVELLKSSDNSEDEPPDIPPRRQSCDNTQFRELPNQSSIDPVDDMPLGASSETFMRDAKNSSAEDDVFVKSNPRRASLSSDVKMTPHSLNRMSVDEIAEACARMGLSKSTVQKFKDEEVDGSFLQSVPVENIDDYFPELNTIEKRKITMFINGHWKSEK